MRVEARVRAPAPVAVFKLVGATPVLAALIVNAILDPSSLMQRDLPFWALAVAATELMPVPTRRGLHLSLSDPILLAVLMIHQPFPSATVAVLGAFDWRELRRTIDPTTALFNRCQI